MPHGTRVRQLVLQDIAFYEMTKVLSTIDLWVSSRLQLTLAMHASRNLCIVMERMTGSLCGLLYGRMRQGSEKLLTPSRQLTIAIGISAGMTFLHGELLATRAYSCTLIDSPMREESPLCV